jgi:hypothetical protein
LYYTKQYLGDVIVFTIDHTSIYLVCVSVQKEKKLKRIMVLGILCIVLINSSGSISRVSATGILARGNLSWRIEPLVNNTDVRSIAIAYDTWESWGAPMVVYHDEINNQFRRDWLVGAGKGNCGVNNGWNCGGWWPEFEGNYNDVSFSRNPETGDMVTGYVISNELENAYYYFKTVKNGNNGYKLLDLDSYPSGKMDSQPSLIMDINGYPYIALIVDGSPYDYLIYIHPVESGGTCAAVGGVDWMDCDTILIGSSIAEDPSIAIASNGTPRIAYYNPGVGALVYAYPFGDPSKANCGPFNDWRCITIDGTLNNGKYPSVAIEDETYIGYYNYSTGALMVAQYVGGGGNCGNDWNGYLYVNRWQCDQIDQVGPEVTKMGLSLVVDGAAPVMAYMDSTGYQTTVKLAQPVGRLGMDVGNCGPIDLFYTWYCETLAQGQYGLGGEIDMTINKSGAIFMAYLESDDYYQQNNLWVARQYFQGFMPLLKK